MSRAAIMIWLHRPFRGNWLLQVINFSAPPMAFIWHLFDYVFSTDHHIHESSLVPVHPRLSAFDSLLPPGTPSAVWSPVYCSNSAVLVPRYTKYVSFTGCSAQIFLSHWLKDSECCRRFAQSSQTAGLLWWHEKNLVLHRGRTSLSNLSCFW